MKNLEVRDFTQNRNFSSTTKNHTELSMNELNSVVGGGSIWPEDSYGPYRPLGVIDTFRSLFGF